MLNFRLFIVVLMLSVVGMPLVADDKRESRTTGNASDQLTGQFAEMATAAKVTRKQAKDILAIQTAMDKALVKWDRANKKKITEAEAKIARTKNSKTRARLDANLKRFKAGRDRLEAGYHNRALSVLTPPQRGEYFGPKLWSAISQEFATVNLDETQEVKAENICKGLAKTTKSDPATNRSLQARARKMVANNVLTKEQKKLMTRRKAPSKTVPHKKKQRRNK